MALIEEKNFDNERYIGNGGERESSIGRVCLENNVNDEG